MTNSCVCHPWVFRHVHLLPHSTTAYFPSNEELQQHSVVAVGVASKQQEGCLSIRVVQSDQKCRKAAAMYMARCLALMVLVLPVIGVVSAVCVDEMPATTMKPKWYHR
jgi:hypothetical protein